MDNIYFPIAHKITFSIDFMRDSDQPFLHGPSGVVNCFSIPAKVTWCSPDYIFKFIIFAY